MALEGTIKDFALPDIFQLIGIQRKTGVLSLLHGDDKVTIKFLEGQVVEADTVSDSLENRLGTVLVRTGRITQEQLDEALEIQRSTLQRLGHILVKRRFVSQDELVDALQIQSSQIIYRLFRWREGSYHFDAVEKLDYDQNHSTPISSETILMEGARMVDEWPIIERRIPSDKLVLRRTDAARDLDGCADPSGDADALSDDDLDIDLGLDLDLPPAEAKPDPPPAPPDAGLKLSPQEIQVLEIVDGRRTVREIVDRLPLAEFETFRTLADMLTRHLIEPVEATPESAVAARRSGLLSRAAGWLVNAAILAGVATGLASLAGNRHAPWTVVEASPATERLRLYASMARLERIETAIRVFYLDAGSFPLNLVVLVQNGYLDAASLTDPWGRPYRLQISAGGYQVLGRDAGGDLSPELTVSRGFTEVQRLLIEADSTE